MFAIVVSIKRFAMCASDLHGYSITETRLNDAFLSIGGKQIFVRLTTIPRAYCNAGY